MNGTFAMGWFQILLLHTFRKSLEVVVPRVAEGCVGDHGESPVKCNLHFCPEYMFQLRDRVSVVVSLS